MILGWTVAAVMELALVYGLYGHLQTGDYMNYHAAAFYNAVSRPLWAVGLGWVVIACVTGHGGNEKHHTVKCAIIKNKSFFFRHSE